MKRRRATFAAVVALLLAATVTAPAGGAAAPRWTVVPTAAGAAFGHLSAVSCVSPSMCVAVGTQDGSKTSVRLIERWNGKKWTTQLSPIPRGAVSSQLSAVQCVTTVMCIAVGQYNTSSATKTMAVRWNGSHWVLQPTPNPAAAVSGLAGVACTSTSSCVAVGGSFVSTETTSSELSLVEQWNGSAWSIVPSPNVSGAFDSNLAGIACPSAVDCVAVGYSHTTLRTNTLVEQYNGSTWAIAPTPNPTNSADNELNGVACPTTTGCLAVGTSDHGTLAERWNGTAWTIVRSPNPTGATGAALTTISCPSALRCFASGLWFRRNVEQRLVVLFTTSGASLIPVPVPSGTKRSNLSGISCAGSTNCFAVGDYRLGTSRRPLLLRYS